MYPVLAFFHGLNFCWQLFQTLLTSFVAEERHVSERSQEDLCFRDTFPAREVLV